MNVTIMLKNWLNGTYSNYGFLVRDTRDQELRTDLWTTFYSSDAASPHKPELHIIYDDVHRFLEYGWQSTVIPIQPFPYYNANYSTAMQQSIPCWNNNTPVEFSLTTNTNNQVYIQDYEWIDNGKYEVIARNGSQVQLFNIKLNSFQILYQSNDNINFIQSVFVHELGHVLWLNDNPITTESSIMDYYRDRFTLISLTNYDIQSVDMMY